MAAAFAERCFLPAVTQNLPLFFVTPEVWISGKILFENAFQSQ